MRNLSTSDLLGLWEAGAGLHLLDRGLLALNTAMPEVSAEALADWPLGHRNKALLDLHSSIFGQALAGWTACEHCREKMEFELSCRELADAHKIHAEHTVRFQGQSFRVPTSRDLAEAARHPDAETAALTLVERCRTGGETSRDWNQDNLEELENALAAADPLAEIRIALRCPDCGHESEETIEIISFLWAEIEAQAKRLFWEIHALARAYGWAESEILSLSPARRALYVEMVQA
jgi:hypothetical protein